MAPSSFPNIILQWDSFLRDVLYLLPNICIVEILIGQSRLLSLMSECSQRNSLTFKTLGISGKLPEQSKEELDEIFCSGKRIKEAPMEPSGPNGAEGMIKVSYKDKLPGIIPEAFEKAFQIDVVYKGDTDDDVGLDEEDKSLKVLLTRDEKLRIRATWRSSLIVKLFSRPLVHWIFK